MGSTGSGRFSDYHDQSGSTGSGAQTGGTSGDDQCSRAFSCYLEDVESYEYHSTKEELPEVGTELFIDLSGRVVAVTVDEELEIGALPTEFNYLAGCLAEELSYEGVVSSVTEEPFVSISVDFAPSDSE